MKAYRENHIEIIDFLRGLAALSVVLFHYATSAIASIKPNMVSEFFEWGTLGVQVFFVISGFIIPYAMYSGSYRLRDMGQYLFRRFMRINPPAYVAVLLVVGLYYAAIYIVGRPIQGMPWPGVDQNVIWGNFTFFYELFRTDPYISVYWTLEIEFQYYIFIGLFYPVMIALQKNSIWLTAAFILYGCTMFVPGIEVFPFFGVSSYFIMGNILFMYKKKMITREYFTWAIIAAMLFCHYQQGVPYSLAAIIALLIISFVRFRNPVTTFLGRISYSLYITHMFAAFILEITLNRVVGTHFDEPLKTLMVIPYTLWSILFAWIFYLWVERPAIKLSKVLTSGNRKKIRSDAG